MANYTILLIDYEPRSIERFRDPLIAAGYAVEIATDGVSGIEAFHRLSPDMVLVEAMIPKKHGFEVCQELKRTPHGRRTPVIITTGVYKGRKYRTQALHIYGCDEYIEKPIAPEQLLEIVGRLLVPGASAPSTGVAESEPVTSEIGGRPRVRENVDAIAKPGPSVVKDDGEDEIMARLDAILPGGGGATPPFVAPERIAVVAAVEQDPFAQMRAELDAELGSMSTPLAFETAPKLEPIVEPFVSDQRVSASVLEALPVPATVIPIALAPSATPVVTDEQLGQIVNIDTKRPRKSKKTERQNQKRSPQVDRVAEVAPAPEAVEVRLPRGTIVESELEATAGRRGMPVWAWSAVAVVAIVGLYFMFPHGGAKQPGAAPLPAPPTRTVASAPPVAIAPTGTVSRIPEPSRAVPDSPKPVLTAVKVPVPKKRPDPAATTAPTLTAASSPKAVSPDPMPPVEPPTNTEPAKPEPAPIEATSPSEPDANVAGVETLPDPAAASPATAIAPGALIPIDVADTMPVSLVHRAPVYSLAAKQLRLSGTVIMNVLVNDRGTVDQVVLVTGVPGADVNDAAMRAAKSWTYRPATKNGVPVKVWKSEQVVLKL